METTVRGYTCRSTLTHYPDSEATSLYSFSLILRALHYKQQIPVDNLWFDPIRIRTHDLRTQGDHANDYTTDESLW